MSHQDKYIDPSIELIANSSRILAIATVALPLLAELVAAHQGKDTKAITQQAWAKVKEIEDQFTNARNKAVEDANN